jgi:plastocyanin
MLRRIGLIAATLMLTSVASVSASTQTITVTTKAYPPSTSAVVGDTVTWDNQSGFNHTVTGDSPLALFNKPLNDGASASRSFTAAGSFPYHCMIHPFMQGDIKVAMTASPTSGDMATAFTISWATITAPNALRYVVQVRAPGGQFAPFRNGAKVPSAVFHPTSTGSWAFRSRLKRVHNGAQSGWSPTLVVQVLP